STLAGLCQHDHRYVAWIPVEWPAHTHPHLTTQRVTAGAFSTLRLEAADLPRGAARFEARALLSLTDTSCPRPGIPHVLMIQQAFLAHQPTTLTFRQTPQFRTKMRL